MREACRALDDALSALRWVTEQRETARERIEVRLSQVETYLVSAQHELTGAPLTCLPLRARLAVRHAMNRVWGPLRRSEARLLRLALRDLERLEIELSRLQRMAGEPSLTPEGEVSPDEPATA